MQYGIMCYIVTLSLAIALQIAIENCAMTMKLTTNIEDIVVGCVNYIPGIRIQYLCFAVIVTNRKHECDIANSYFIDQL